MCLYRICKGRPYEKNPSILCKRILMRSENNEQANVLKGELITTNIDLT